MAEEQAGTEDVFSPESEEAPEPTFEERASQRLDTLETMIRNESSRWNGIQGIYDRNTAAITKLESSIEERYGNTKKAEALLEQVAKLTLGDEAWKAWEQQQEMADLRRKVEAPKPKEGESQAPSKMDSINTAYNATTIPSMKRRVAAIGYSFELAMNLRPDIRGAETDEDPMGLLDFEEEWFSKVLAAKKRAESQAKPRTTVDTLRGGGGGTKRGNFTPAEIKAMSPEEFAQNREAVYASMANA